MARNFSGGFNSISGSNSLSINSNTATTVSIWFRPANAPGATGNCFVYGQNGSADPELHLDNTNVHYGWAGNGTVAVAGLWTAGVWANWTIAFNGVDTLYINGSSVASNNPGFVGPQTVSILIGLFAGNSANGDLADYALWDGVALTASEVKALAAGARPWTIRPGNLKVYYPIDGLQSPEPDLSGNANNGVISSSPVRASGPPVMMFTPRWTQHLPTPIPAFNINIGAGTYALTDESLTLLKTSKLFDAAGNYALTGENVRLLKASLSHAATAVYSLNGQNVVLAVGHKIGVGVGLYALTGETVHTYFGHTVRLQAGTYVVVGDNEILTATRRILLQSGFVQVAGESVRLAAVFPFVPPSPPKLLGLEAISNLFGSM